MKKRTESHLTTACLKYLKILENQGYILWLSRLNSGKIFTGKYMIQLCREGTADLFFIMHTKTVWIECKSGIGKVSEAQLRFKDAVETAGHIYAVVRDIYDLQKLWLSLKT